MTADRLLYVWPDSGICAVHRKVIKMLGQENEESLGNGAPRNSLLGPQRDIVEPYESLVVNDIMLMFYCN